MADGTEPSGVLVRYRVVGGPMHVDQRLTVREDGHAEVDERHRSRGEISVEVEPGELERLREALAVLPESRWSGAAGLAWARLKRNTVRAIPHNRFHGARTHFELRRGGRAISGYADDAGDLAAVPLLDALRVRAIRSAPR